MNTQDKALQRLYSLLKRQGDKRETKLPDSPKYPVINP
jgi:hypothetical protein